MFQRGDVVRLVDSPYLPWEVMALCGVTRTLQLHCLRGNVLIEVWATYDDVVLVREAITEGAVIE